MKNNFKISEEERSQIMEMHKSYGYKKPLNEMDGGNIDDFLNYKNKSREEVRAAKQFQKDFGSEFSNADDEVPFWEKDKPRPSGNRLVDKESRSSHDSNLRRVSEKGMKNQLENIGISQKQLSGLINGGGGDKVSKLTDLIVDDKIGTLYSLYYKNYNEFLKNKKTYIESGGMDKVDNIESPRMFIEKLIRQIIGDR